MNLEIHCWCCNDCIESRRSQQSRRLKDLYKTKPDSLSPFSSPSKSPLLSSSAPLLGDTAPGSRLSYSTSIIHQDCLSAKTPEEMCFMCQRQIKRYGDTEDPPIAGVPSALQPWINPVSILYRPILHSKCFNGKIFLTNILMAL